MTDIEHAKKYAEESISLEISMTNPKAEAIAESACLYGLTYKNKRIAELKAQIEKMLHTFIDLLWFEDNLDPYMYECNDAQKGELLKPFSEARDILKAYECKKCNGKGTIFTKKWHTEATCPVCKGTGYVLGDKRK